MIKDDLIFYISTNFFRDEQSFLDIINIIKILSYWDSCKCQQFTIKWLTNGLLRENLFETFARSQRTTTIVYVRVSET